MRNHARLHGQWIVGVALVLAGGEKQNNHFSFFLPAAFCVVLDVVRFSVSVEKLGFVDRTLILNESFLAGL